MEAEAGPHRVPEVVGPSADLAQQEGPLGQVGGHGRTRHRDRAGRPGPLGGRSARSSVHRAPHPARLGEAVGQHQPRAVPDGLGVQCRRLARARRRGRKVEWPSVVMGSSDERTEGRWSPGIRTRRRPSPPPWSTSGCGRGAPTPWCARDRGRPRWPWPWPPTRRWPCTSAWTSGRPASPPSGSGRATGRPAVVVTTSGTAAAELHAAVVEADLGRRAADRLHRRPSARAPRRGRPPDHRPDPSLRQLPYAGSATRGCPTAGAARDRGGRSAARSVAEAIPVPAGPVPSISTCPSGSRCSAIRPPEEGRARDARRGCPGTRWSTAGCRRRSGD